MKQIGILITPEKTIVATKTFSYEEMPLEKMYELLGCSTVDVVSLDHNIDMWVDDEGLLKSGNMVMDYTISNDAPIKLSGNVLLLASNDEGETIGLSDEQLSWIQKNLTYRAIGYVR